MNIRKEYVKLVEDVRDAGGEVKIFSSMHISGQRKLIALHPKLNTKNRLSISHFITELAQICGIAAMLRFPMPELEDDDDNEDDNDSPDSDSDN